MPTIKPWHWPSFRGGDGTSITIEDGIVVTKNTETGKYRNTRPVITWIDRNANVEFALVCEMGNLGAQSVYLRVFDDMLLLGSDHHNRPDPDLTPELRAYALEIIRRIRAAEFARVQQVRAEAEIQKVAEQAAKTERLTMLSRLVSQ